MSNYDVKFADVIHKWILNFWICLFYTTFDKFDILRQTKTYII